MNTFQSTKHISFISLNNSKSRKNIGNFIKGFEFSDVLIMAYHFRYADFQNQSQFTQNRLFEFHSIFSMSKWQTYIKIHFIDLNLIWFIFLIEFPLQMISINDVGLYRPNLAFIIYCIEWAYSNAYRRYVLKIWIRHSMVHHQHSNSFQWTGTKNDRLYRDFAIFLYHSLSILYSESKPIIRGSHKMFILVIILFYFESHFDLTQCIYI